MPTLMPEGLGPSEHLRVGLGLVHPVARPIRLKPHIHHAVDNQHTDPGHLVGFRKIIVDLVVSPGALLQVANDALLKLVD